MKIGFVFDDSLDKTDGVQQYIITLGKWFHLQGHEVHYLVGQTSRQDLAHIHSLSKNVQVNFNQNRMSMPLPAKRSKIRQLLEREKFDVLHVQMPYSPFMAGRVINAAPRSTVVFGTFHILPFSLLEKVATKILRLLVWRSLRRFDEVVSVSAPAAKFARRSFATQSKVVPNAVSVAGMSSGKALSKYQDKKINIVFLGRLVERKGCLHLLKALQILHKQGHLAQSRVLICGKGADRNSLEKFVTQNHLGNIVTFVGFLSEKVKADYLATADLAVFPSTGGESFGIVLIEAMAAGSGAVIAGDNLGYRSVMDNHETQIVNPYNHDEFAKKIWLFIKSTRARNVASKWQDQVVKKYDVKVIGEELLHRYKRCVAKQHKDSHN